MLRTKFSSADIDRLVSKLRARFPGRQSNSITILDTEVDLLNKEDRGLLKEAMEAGLLLTESQFIAREMGQDLLRQLVERQSLGICWREFM